MRRELAVSIMQKNDGLIRLILKMQPDVAGLLGQPGCARIDADTGQVDPATGDVHEEEHEAVEHTRPRDDLLGDEVARPKGVLVSFQEFRPTPLAALGAGLEAGVRDA